MRKAICIPTYNRPEAINELLTRCLYIYCKLGYDLYIYDSSTNEDTKEVVDQYIKDAEGLFYLRVDSKIHSNMKVYLIYEEFWKKQSHDYIWVQSDSIRWTEDSLESITNVINGGKYDFVIPNYRDVEKIGNKEYREHNDFFRDCAWHMTLYGATIVRIDSVLKEADWDMLKEKYSRQDRINFSHVGLYFEQILKMDSFCAYHMTLSSNSLTSTLYKKASGWRRETFFILCECWPNVINALPSSYLYKKEVIQKHAVNADVLMPEGIKKLRSEGILNYKVYRKYRGVWRQVSNVSDIMILLYSVIPQRIITYFIKDNINEMKIKRKLKRFCAEHSEIYIYGCGQKGDIYASFLESMDIPYKGFLISEGQKDKSDLHGKPVEVFDDKLLNNRKVGLILALNEKNFGSVVHLFTPNQLATQVFSEYK